MSSRLLEYEVWAPLHGRGLTGACGEAARQLLGRVALLDLAPSVLARALEPFPCPDPVRTLDSLHLASCRYLVENGQAVSLATFDRRMIAAARSINIPLFELESPA